MVKYRYIYRYLIERGSRLDIAEGVTTKTTPLDWHLTMPWETSNPTGGVVSRMQGRRDGLRLIEKARNEWT